ncbi:MAG: hypothetical protein ACI4LK_04495 [Lentihominibacter sp.]
MIDRKDFERLRALKQELQTIEKRIRRTPNTELLGDTYGDYRTGYKHIRMIQGKSNDRKRRLEERYKTKVGELVARIERTEDAMEQIEDPVIRDIFRLYYQEGLSEEAVADLKGYSRPRISQLINEFWKEDKD